MRIWFFVLLFFHFLFLIIFFHYFFKFHSVISLSCTFVIFIVLEVKYPNWLCHNHVKMPFAIQMLPLVCKFGYFKSMHFCGFVPYRIFLSKIFLKFFACTVKPAYNDHPWDREKVVVVRRWSLFEGQTVKLIFLIKKIPWKQRVGFIICYTVS